MFYLVIIIVGDQFYEIDVVVVDCGDLVVVLVYVFVFVYVMDYIVWVFDQYFGVGIGFYCVDYFEVVECEYFQWLFGVVFVWVWFG